MHQSVHLLRPLLAAFTVLLLPLVGWAGTGAPQGRYAVVIGANLGEPGEEPLRFAERDASRFADVLARFADVPPQNMVLLRGRDAATVESALAALGDRLAASQARGEETVLFVYYSGHADAQAMHLGPTRLPFKRLKNLVGEAGARLSVLVVDACRSGALTRVKGIRTVQPFEIKARDDLASEGTAIITSSAAGEDAQESDRLGGGVFSHHFIAGLLGAADASGDQRVTLSEAYRYAYGETLRTTSRAPVVQHPTFAFRMRGKRDLVVTRLSDSAGLGRLAIEGAGEWLLLPEKGAENGATEVRSEQNTEILIEPGGYLVRRRTRAAIYEGRATVTSGSQTRLAATDLERVPYGVTVRKGYDEDRRSAWGGLSDVEAGMAFREGLGGTVYGAVGGRADFEAFALELRARFGQSSAAVHQMDVIQRQLGADLTALRLFDIGNLGAGFGLRIGGDWVEQSFDTAGDAPDRNALAGRAGALLRLEYAVLPWMSARLTGGVDAYVFPEPGKIDVDAAPFAGLGVTVYVP